ncbi:MAG: sulfotransferase family protein [Thermaurantiacus sp.]
MTRLAPPPRPRLYRPAMGAMETLWKRQILPYPDLDFARIVADAERQTGLSDHGNRAFFDRQLSVLLPALREEARLNTLGDLFAHGNLLKLVMERLRAVDLLKRHPEIRRIALAPPVIVVGPMRSGTTRLQRLLASVPGFTALRLYEVVFPVPGRREFAARAAGRPDPRIAATDRMYRFLWWLNPANRWIHPTGPMEVDEELAMLEQSCAGSQVEAQRRVPSFARHCEATDQSESWRYLRDLLKLRTWFTGTDPSLPFVLKTPQSMQDLDAIHATFPDAHYVFIHRDPVSVVASAASLAWNQMVIQSDDVDARWVGQEWLWKTEHRIGVTARARERIAPDRQMDVTFEEMNADWRGVMRRVLGVLGREVTPNAEAGMAAYMARAAREHGHANHRYAPRDFGLEAGAIRERFRDYACTYGLGERRRAA